MIFREEYRKYNDSVHAPKSILESVKKAAADEDAEETIPLFESKPKRRWISIATYSGVAVAAAALVLLIFNPFRGNYRNQKNAQATSVEAGGAAYASDTAVLSYAVPAESFDEKEAVPESDSVSGILSNAVPELSKSSEMEDNESEEVFENAIDDFSYYDIYSWLSPVSDSQSSQEINAPVLLTKESGARYSENKIIIGDQSVELSSERTIRALADLSGKILSVSEYNGLVYISVIEKVQDDYVITDEAYQSGIYISCMLHDSTVFENENLNTYSVFEVITKHTVDIAKATSSDPQSFCPVISDYNGTRPLSPSEITIYEPSNCYTVYAGYECSDNLRILYSFAEFGLE